MATMLENYRHRFGSAVKAQGNGFNGPCPLCGGEPGKSDRFIIWPDREHDLGHTCAVNHIATAASAASPGTASST